MKQRGKPMKRTTLWTTAGIALTVFVAIAASVAYADYGRSGGWCGRRWHRMGPMAYVGRQLGLSSAQVSQIRSIAEEERPKAAQLLKELADGLHQLQDSTSGENIDQSKVEAIANAEGHTVAELLLEREHFKSRVYTTVLNEQQRKSADALQKRLIGRLDEVVSRLRSSDR
jgi:Spy/CpxP family protein refolding chaperone